MEWRSTIKEDSGQRTADSNGIALMMCLFRTKEGGDRDGHKVIPIIFSVVLSWLCEEVTVSLFSCLINYTLVMSVTD